MQEIFRLLEMKELFNDVMSGHIGLIVPTPDSKFLFFIADFIQLRVRHLKMKILILKLRSFTVHLVRKSLFSF